MTRSTHGGTRPGPSVSEKPGRQRTTRRGTVDGAAPGSGAPGGERVISRGGVRVAPARAARLWVALHLVRKPHPVAPPAAAERPVSRYRAKRYGYLEQALMAREMDRL